MHCSANVGAGGDVALFFGLSGTGKTTLSSDPERTLIGDDEHGWSDRGVFNFEGGCYAKTIRLSPEAEPQIYATTRRFGTVLENVVVDPDTRALDLDDERYTENTRGGVSDFVHRQRRAVGPGRPSAERRDADRRRVRRAAADRAADAGRRDVSLPVGLHGQGRRHREGRRHEPKATFSTCFGAPFLPLAPSRYATMLGERIAKHGVRVWLVNTGWTGGPFGVGQRMKIGYTRAMIRAALVGRARRRRATRDPIFNIDIPTSCPDVPAAVLQPRTTWANGADYDAQATKLARMFRENFTAFADGVGADVIAAGPNA